MTPQWPAPPGPLYDALIHDGWHVAANAAGTHTDPTVQFATAYAMGCETGLRMALGPDSDIARALLLEIEASAESAGHSDGMREEYEHGMRELYRPAMRGVTKW